MKFINSIINSIGIHIKNWITLYILFSFGVFIAAMVLFNNSTSLSTLPVDHTSGLDNKSKTGRILKGEKVRAVFIAAENNLGIISVRLKNYNKWNIDEDEIVFRIKEEGDRKWYYERAYGGGNFRTLTLYPFGFPTIVSSKNKKYIVEIISQRGTGDNSLTFNPNHPAIVGSYQFSKAVLVSNKTVFLHFVAQKITFSLSNPISILIIALSFSPFLTYLIFKNVIEVGAKRIMKQLKGNERVQKGHKLLATHIITLNTFSVIFLLYLIILIPIFLFTGVNGYLLSYTMFLWVLGVWFYKLPSVISFFSSIFMLGLTIIFLTINKPLLADESSIWVFLFLLIGLVHAWIELRDEKKLGR